MSTPDLYLATGFLLNDEGRIVSTREPVPSAGPLFTLIRSATQCVWAVRADVPHGVAREIDQLAGEEQAVSDLRAEPVHARRYVSLLAATKQYGGPAFTFPNAVASPSAGIAIIQDEASLERNFRGWVPGEIAAGRAPVLAMIEDGAPVSICFCARRSDAAAEAGLETAKAYRGRGFGARVTAAWAAKIRASGRTPLYSTFWDNHASLAVARKLGLVAYASSWSLTRAPSEKESSQVRGPKSQVGRGLIS